MAFETKLTPVKIGLAEMLDAIWDEIQNAASQAQSRGYGRFVFEEAEIEVAVAVEAKTEAKLNLHIVEFGGGLTGTRTATLRIKVKQYTESVAKGEPGRWVFLLEKGTPAVGADTPERASSPEEAVEIAKRKASIR